MTQDVPIHDPRVLRAIAHPVRTAILGEIEAGGPVRAADVAQALDIPANQASFHLRQLAKYGLVEEAPEAARDKRDRVWKATSRGVSANLNDLAKTPGGQAAVEVFRHSASAWAHHLIDVAIGPTEEKDTIRTMANQSVRLTKQEADQLRLEMQDLIEGWADRTRGRDDTSRRTYSVLQVLQPYPKLFDPEDPESPGGHRVLG